MYSSLVQSPVQLKPRTAPAKALRAVRWQGGVLKSIEGYTATHTHTHTHSHSHSHTHSRSYSHSHSQGEMLKAIEGYTAALALSDECDIFSHSRSYTHTLFVCHSLAIYLFLCLSLSTRATIAGTYHRRGCTKWASGR